MKIVKFYNHIFNIEHISYFGIQTRVSNICLIIILLAGNEICFQYPDLNSANIDLTKLELSIQAAK